MNWLGVDGGGSSLRVVIVDDALRERASVQGEAVNPGAVGQPVAAERIRAGVRAALAAAGLAAGDIAGAGIGVAGAAAEHSAPWLRAALAPVLPGVAVYPSADTEIALVGARGRLDGLVLLCGTGSVAYGVSPDGRRQRAGGWGYLLGDEGSGYWIGMQALRMLTHYGDNRLSIVTRLPQVMMQAIAIAQPLDVIRWMYQQAGPHEVAALAQRVLTLADDGDAGAAAIITDAAQHLCALARHVLAHLDLTPQAVVFAGSLLTHENALSRAVTASLGLPAVPVALHSPVTGAALFARLSASAPEDR